MTRRRIIGLVALMVPAVLALALGASVAEVPAGSGGHAGDADDGPRDVARLFESLEAREDAFESLLDAQLDEFDRTGPNLSDPFPAGGLAAVNLSGDAALLGDAAGFDEPVESDRLHEVRQEARETETRLDEMERTCDERRQELRERLRDAQTPREHEQAGGALAELQETCARTREHAHALLDALRDEEAFVAAKPLHAAAFGEELDALRQARLDLVGAHHDAQDRLAETREECALREQRLQARLGDAQGERARDRLSGDLAALRDDCAAAIAALEARERSLGQKLRQLDAGGVADAVRLRLEG